MQEQKTTKNEAMARMEMDRKSASKKVEKKFLTSSTGTRYNKEAR